MYYCAILSSYLQTAFTSWSTDSLYQLIYRQSIPADLLTAYTSWSTDSLYQLIYRKPISADLLLCYTDIWSTDSLYQLIYRQLIPADLQTANTTWASDSWRLVSYDSWWLVSYDSWRQLMAGELSQGAPGRESPHSLSLYTTIVLIFRLYLSLCCCLTQLKFHTLSCICHG